MKPSQDPTAEEAAIADAIRKLRPEEAEHFLRQLERAIAKRRLQLWGYLLALLVWAVAMFFALAHYGAADPQSFRAWVFALPFGGLALVLWGMGTWAERVGRDPAQAATRPAAVRKPPTAPPASDGGAG